MVSLHPFKIIGVSPQLDLLKRLDKRLVSRLNACILCLPPPLSVAEVCEVRIVLYEFSRLTYQHLCRFIYQSLHDMFLPASPECSMEDSDGGALLREQAANLFGEQSTAPVFMTEQFIRDMVLSGRNLE